MTSWAEMFFSAAIFFIYAFNVFSLKFFGALGLVLVMMLVPFVYKAVVKKSKEFNRNLPLE